MKSLTPEKALIFRITHIENVAWILENGLHCRNSDVLDPSYRDIGNPDLIEKRKGRVVRISPGGTLSDYVPFYFTPCTPMLYNIKTGFRGMKQTGMSEIAILVSSLLRLSELEIPFVFTDRHAYLEAAEFYSRLEDLSRIDWGILQRRDFRGDPDDPGKLERYQAEALAYKSLPVSALLGIACQNPQSSASLLKEAARRGLQLRVVSKPEWYP